MQDIQSILTELGYNLTPDSNGWRAAALYRQGDNGTALKIYNKPSENGIIWYDYVENTKGTLEDLIKLTLGEKVDAKAWLSGKINLDNLNNYKKPQIVMPQILPKNLINELIKDYSYFNNRSISTETLQQFPCGVCLDSQTILGKYKNRFVFFIQNSKGEFVGISARDLTGQSKAKWKTAGQKNDFCFPLYINKKIVKEKDSIYIFEGIGDVLSMFEVGLKNCCCLFGCEMGFGLLNVLLKLNPKKIYLSLNSDEPGQIASEKLKRRLYRYFNVNQIEIKYPPTCNGCKDLNDVLLLSNGRKIIEDWYNNRYN